MMQRKAHLVLLAILLLAATSARATTLARLTIEQMTAAAAVVARVRCVASEARWSAGELWTHTTFEVIEVWKGQAPRTIAVRLIGGRAGNIISSVPEVPRFEPGEDVVLFLEPASAGEFTVTSWAQGTFRIRRDLRSGAERVTQDSAGLPVFDPATRQFRAEGMRGALLENLRARIEAATSLAGGNPGGKQ
jgi:hypothetical protein